MTTAFAAAIAVLVGLGAGIGIGFATAKSNEAIARQARGRQQDQQQPAAGLRPGRGHRDLRLPDRHPADLHAVIEGAMSRVDFKP